MDKIIKAKLVLPPYLTVDARELIRSVRYDRVVTYLLDISQKIVFNIPIYILDELRSRIMGVGL